MKILQEFDSSWSQLNKRTLSILEFVILSTFYSSQPYWRKKYQWTAANQEQEELRHLQCYITISSRDAHSLVILIAITN